QVERRIGDEDGAVISGNLALVGGVGVPGRSPAGRRRIDDLRVVHQHVRAIHIGHAVVMAVDGVVPRRLQGLDDVLEVRNQVDVDLRHVAVGDQAVGRVAAGGNAIPLGAAALAHQGDHLVRGDGELYVYLATGLVGARRHPINLWVRLAALDVSGPGDQVEGPLA